MAEESMIPSLSSAGIGSRFVSQDDLDTAKARRDEQWKAAYARIGMEPPPQQQEDFSDGRSLAEKLAANKIKKQEEWEERTKLANQFRALEEDEVMFLDSVREKLEAEERQRKEQDGEEVQNFREAVAARTSAMNNPPPLASNLAAAPTISTPSKPAPAPARKKGLLKGVVVKKKAKPTTATRDDTNTKDNEEDEQPDTKRRRISES
ncbi:N-terminal domain of NEFA-interacting nuclear protein NIP30-domain-containing protein [Mycena pura]|uniref:N-terminal domain of NEFA-interacting nuclear protein NIP30-domain-containing protein n=1 Tax=Mycena pura TaxID=153505 RepID=A0AAD7E3F9_9AGAR|nr:N-terminal domain of NEFA-interacting nuclear protein NIP30-domain-containing protein [Mycena pura]